MFDNLISVRRIDTTSASYQTMVAALERDFKFKEVEEPFDFTRFVDFIPLHRITRQFYAIHCPDIYSDFVPLYHSLWKLRVKDAATVSNLHQDGGVHYFSRNGYQSRMVTVWTNIYRDDIPGMSGSDMGIFVIDNDGQTQRELYERLARENTHFFEKRPGQLTDNMYVCGKVIQCDTRSLPRRVFDYEEGVSIRFNSHLLHGSGNFTGPLGLLTPTDLEKFRVSLTSVWIHRDDLDWEIVSMPDDRNEELYLSKVGSQYLTEVRKHFSAACEYEHRRLLEIKKLIAEHTTGSLSTSSSSVL